eukprot:SM000144S00688  [mRNA]  locus=s144:335896:337084:+ [translate_table: standard]
MKGLKGSSPAGGLVGTPGGGLQDGWGRAFLDVLPASSSTPEARRAAAAQSDSDSPSNERRGGRRKARYDEERVHLKLAEIEQKLEQLRRKKEKYKRRLDEIQARKEQVAGPIKWESPGSVSAIASAAGTASPHA